MYSLKMHDIALTFLLFSLLVLTSARDVNYCGSKLCGFSNKHTLCIYASGPSESCTGFIRAPLLPEEKSRILARLNQRRNDAASGNLRGLPSAGNMLRLRWVQELAREAQLWADQCRPPQNPEEHDTCRDLYAITVGQCVASVIGESPGLHVESMVDIWYMQSLYYKGNVTMFEPPDPSRYYYGDFAQILWAETFMVGCGRSRFMLASRGRLRTIERLVCNFAPKGPADYNSIWTIGLPASACPPHSLPYDPLPSLCDYKNELNQSNDNDTAVPIEKRLLLNIIHEIEKNETQYEETVDEIYLTRLAKVTMEVDNATHYNSIQKRDVVDNMDLEKQNIKMNTIYTTNVTNTSDLNTELQKIENNATRLYKKFKMVGRPKTYNIEELSDTGDDKKEEKKNNRHVTEPILTERKKEFYYDYSMNFYEETLNDNVTRRIEQVTMENYFNENYTIGKFEDRKYLMWPLTANISYDSSDQAILNAPKNVLLAGKTQIDSDNNTAFNNESTTDSERVLDYFLSDPETVKQLQDALAHAERQATTLSKPISKIRKKAPGKSRRDLRDSDVASEQLGEEFNDLSFVSDDFTLVTDSDISIATTAPVVAGERNTSVTPAPILDMMMKYMPYLKTYENGAVGPNLSNSSTHFGLEPECMCFIMLISRFVSNFIVL